MAWTKKNLYDRIYDRFTEKDTDYAKVNNNRDVITTYFRSDEIVDTDEKGNLVGQCIYSGGGPWYSRLMSTGFQGSLVSKNIAWHMYQMGRYELKGIDELDVWLQQVREFMTAEYQRSNFYDVQPQFTHEGVTTGSPVMFGEEDLANERTMWMPQHYKNIRLFYDKYNQDDGAIMLDKTWTAKKIFDTFIVRDDDAYTKSAEKLSNAVVQCLRSGRLDEEFTVYRATFKVTDPIWNGDGFTKPRGAWTWLTAYFLELTEAEGDKKNAPLNDNMGDFSQPYSVWNYDKKPWEASSRTPAFSAIWDNLSLQQIDKNLLENVQNINRPAFVALDSQRNKVDLSPEGEMYVTDAEYDRPPKMIDRVGGLQFSRDLFELKDEALQRWFFIDQFAMFSRLARDKNQPVTATQIWQMMGEKATLLSPAIETHSKYLSSVDARMIDIASRRGQGPFNRRVVENIADIVDSVLGGFSDGIDIQPLFVGPLAQAQMTSQALQPIQAWMAEVGPLMEFNPQLRHRYRWPQLAGKIEDAVNFPQDVIVPQEEYDEIVKAENAAALAQREQENAVEMMKASKNLQGPVDDTSVMAQVAEAV
ncbi:hypothetical protein LCGC14_1093010 [marine sediment metagenome]|uniref:Bacteriophage head to tail connecting protein n=1 Tax=marine sediment metagenome TaxID=412755 RepID=A0A0F9QHU4_9ZZZZ